MYFNRSPFTYKEAYDLWARLVAGWQNRLDAEGARTLFDGRYNRADVGGSYEGVTRMMWGIGGWLSQPQRSGIVTWRGQNYDLVDLLTTALVNGCNPDSPSYWGIDYLGEQREYDQRTVETGQIAFCIWQSRARVWDKMSAKEQGNVIDFLTRFGKRPSTWGNNWALFWVLNHAVRKALGAPYDQTIIDDVMGDYLDGVYCGDGWYDDAAKRGANYFDDYNTWVFASHVMAWAQVDGESDPTRRTELLGRVREWMQNYPDFFSASGAYSEFGRSLAYKFSRLGVPLWAHKLGIWPHRVGMLKRLVGRHLRWYVDRGAVRADGTLRQSLTAGGSVEICEQYISTGATYWAMQAFGGLWSLPDDDSFWKAEEEPLPSEQEDLVKVFQQPGWVVTSTNGEVQRFNAGSVKDPDGYGQKYSKFMYGTLHPFNVGLTRGFAAPDNMLCLADGRESGQRTRNLAFAVGEPGWLRFKWQQRVSGIFHDIETVIVANGEQHVRAHRIMLNRDSSLSLSAIEGGSPLGYIQGGVPDYLSGDNHQITAINDHACAIRAIKGYSTATIWQGDPSINSVYPYYVVPALTIDRVNDTHELICLVHDGLIGDPSKLVGAQIDVIWETDGTVNVIWNDETLSIPALEG